MFQQFVSDAARQTPPTPDPQGLKSKCGGVKCLGDKQRDSSGERLASGTYSAVVKLARKKNVALLSAVWHGTERAYHFRVQTVRSPSLTHPGGADTR